MKKSVLGAMALALTISTTNGQQISELSTGWTLQQRGGSEVYRATVPSTVMGTLTANGLYANLLEGTNYKTADRTPFDEPWIYRTTFSLRKPSGSKGISDRDRRVFLEFDGVTYRAEVRLNGHTVACAREMFGPFCRWEFDVTDLVQAENSLEVEVFRAKKGDLNIGFVDWNPRPLDENMGIFRPVRVRVTDGVRLKNSFVRSEVNIRTLDEARLTIETDVTNHSTVTISGVVEGRIGTVRFARPVTLAAGESRHETFTQADAEGLRVQNPRLWWCAGMGNPEMYELEMKFVTTDAKNRLRTLDSERISFGIRQIETYFTPEGHKGFALNGKPVLVKGAGWTDDIFLRDTPTTNEHQVRMVKSMGLNTIRFENIWGTSQNIYDLCDRHGIMAMVGWSCQWEWEAYLGAPEDEFMSIRTPEDMSLAVRYLHDQVMWLRNHPAIIAWYGGSDKLARPELEKRYRELLARIDNRPYVGSAKAMTSEVTGPSGMKMYGPYEYVGPNYWYLDTEAGGAYGFNTETGPGAQLPVLESINKFIPADELWPMGPSWDYHCTTSGSAMNSLKTLTRVIAAKYGEAQGLDDFLRRADLVSYGSTKSMFEAFRANKPHTTGLIQWMLNSAWPSMYWQLYDWYGLPTASYYAVKKACAPHQLVYNYKDSGIWLVNELTVDASGFRAVVKSFDRDSKLLNTNELVVSSVANSSKKIAEISSPETAFVALSLVDRSGVQVAENFYALAPEHDVYDWKLANWVTTPITKHADFRWLSNLAPLSESALVVTPQVNGRTVSVTIENTSDVIAFFTLLKLKTADGEMVSGAFWNDNYLNLLPGERRTVECVIDSENDKNVVSKGAKTPASSAAKTLPKGLELHIEGWNTQLRKVAIE